MRNLIIAICILCVVAVGYLWYQGLRIYPFSANGAPVEVLSPELKTDTVSVSDIRRIGSIRLNFGIFDNPMYTQLQLKEYPTLNLNDIPRGRNNPFQR